MQPESDAKDWDELTMAERRAAHILGYTKNTWDGDSDDTDESSDGDKKDTDDTSNASSDESEDWAHLSKEARNAARILGYTRGNLCIKLKHTRLANIAPSSMTP